MHFVFLKEIKQSWDSFNLFRRWISRLFHHYNKNTPLYCQQSNHTDSLSREEFKALVFGRYKKELRDSFSNVLTDIRGDTLFSDNIISKSSDKINLLQSILSLFEELLEEKAADRGAFYNNLNAQLEDDTKTFLLQRVDSWSEHDCTGYLKLAKQLKVSEESILARVFENRQSFQFIRENLGRIFYNVVLKAYCPVLLEDERGFVHLFSTAHKEVPEFITLVLGTYI